MITARQIFRELGGAQKKKAMDFLRTNPTSRRIFRVNFTQDFWDDLRRRRDGKLDQHVILNSWGETGCLDENTRLHGGQLIADLEHNQQVKTWSYDFMANRIEQSKSQVFYSGERDVYEIVLEDGRKIIATRDHKFFVLMSGFVVEKTVSELVEGQRLVTI